MGIGKTNGSLKSAVFGYMEKKAIKKAIQGMWNLREPLRCMPHQMVIHIIFNDKEGARVIIGNTENGRYIDETDNANEMRKDNSTYDEFVTKITDSIQNRADFWETPISNIVFRAYLLGDIQRPEVIAELRPVKGFPESEVMFLIEPKKHKPLKLMVPQLQ